MPFLPGQNSLFLNFINNQYMFWCQLLWTNILLLHHHLPWVPWLSFHTTYHLLPVSDSVPHLGEISLFYLLTFSSVAYGEFLTSEMLLILIRIICVLHSYHLSPDASIIFVSLFIMTSSSLSFRCLEMFIRLLSVADLFSSPDMVLFWFSLSSLTLHFFCSTCVTLSSLWTLVLFKSLRFLYNTKQYSTLGNAFSWPESLISLWIPVFLFFLLLVQKAFKDSSYYGQLYLDLLFHMWYKFIFPDTYLALSETFNLHLQGTMGKLGTVAYTFL